MTRRRRLAVLALLAGLFAPQTAQAAWFAEDGTFVFDADAAARQDFEDDAFATDNGITTVEDANALSGKKVVSLAQFGQFGFSVSLPREPATYRVSMWIRDGSVVGSVVLHYSDLGADEVGVFYPTGRMTSDGWVEVANEGIRVDGTRVVKVDIGGFAASGGLVDAVEIVRDGGPWQSGELRASCGGAVDQATCGVGQVCTYSVCQNVNGWVPPIPQDRDQVATYLRNRAEYLFGPYLERTQDLPAARASFDTMLSAGDPWSYWNGFLLGIRRLHDGHTTTSGVSDFVLFNPRPLSICFLEGDADLTHGAAPADPLYLDVLVSHRGADHNLGLAPGDRLVNVDGQHPIAWARSLIDVYWPLAPISNHNTYAELASSLGRLISRFAHQIQVIRCDPATQTCGALETISIADLPLEAEGSPIDRVTCDNRPLRHLPTSPADHAESDTVAISGIVNDSDDVEKIYGLEWESLYTTNGSDGIGSALNAAVNTWKSAGARGIILDHRTGFGGTTYGAKPLWDFTVKRFASDRYIDRRRDLDEQPTLAEGLLLFDEGLSEGDTEYIGSNNPTTSVPVALLITEDVSASDWLPFGMKGAQHTRIFGPFETNGAFSTRYSFGYWLGLNYVIATGDTVASDGRTLNGTGIAPDEVVLPKQSDLLIGKDSVYEAALAWVRQELAP